ncbi:MAG: class I SAM-dependent methyltransferase [Myxococcales bacterium]|nr:class I SAM-dependent methyltransferase [Myxococcales bacterium]
MGKKDKHRQDAQARTLAEQADRHLLYEMSVQCPEVDIALYNRVFKSLRGRPPVSVREDFCGTAYFSTEWCRRYPERTAVGVDLDPEVLAWARDHNLAGQPESVQKRIKLLQQNVLEVTAPKVDVVSVMNFSFWVWKTRAELERYCRVIHQTLGKEGVAFLEIYGGTEAMMVAKDKRKVDDFTYMWEQAEFNPITHETLCHIHFRFKDGSKLKRAFTYDWRLWTIPEVRECLYAAGFKTVDCYWLDVDTDRYHKSEREEQQLAFLAYLAAAK